MIGGGERQGALEIAREMPRRRSMETWKVGDKVTIHRHDDGHDIEGAVQSPE